MDINISMHNLPGFVQISMIPEPGDDFMYPEVTQFRMGLNQAEAIGDILEYVLQESKERVVEAMIEHCEGLCVIYRPVTAIGRNRYQLVFDQDMFNLSCDNFNKFFQAWMKEYENK